MKIIFYSTCSNYYDESSIQMKQFPSCADLWEKVKFAQKNQVVIMCQKPAPFLIDLNGLKIAKKAKNIEYKIFNTDDEKEIANLIIKENPDIAIASTFWVRPFDWLGIKDSIVANYLKKNNIKTICHDLPLEIDCFDKWRTHNLLEKYNFKVAKAVYVHHELFMNAGNRRELKSNVYKTSVLLQLKNLNYPVIIKDTTGLSSFGMDKVDSYEQVIDILKSKKFTSDRIVEEYISGEQFGCEIYGSDGKYKIFDPFLISTNKYGITSPKQNIKIGPVTDKKYKIQKLKKMLLNLVKKLNFSGCVQVDLIFDKKNWHIVEINPRLSGMSETYAFASGKTIYDNLYECATMTKDILDEKLNYLLDIKFPLPSDKIFKKLKHSPQVKFIAKTENPCAKQIREQGFCQIIVGCTQTIEELKEQYLKISHLLPQEEQEMCERMLF